MKTPLAVASEDESGGDEYTGFVQYLFGQVFHIGIRVEDFPPQEHAYLFGVERAAQGVHDFLGQLPAAAIYVEVCLFVPFRTVPVCLCSCKLHGAERARVDVALYFQYPLDTRQPGMLWLLLIELNSMQHSFAPSMFRMLMGLRFRMKLYGLSFTITMLCRRAKSTSF